MQSKLLIVGGGFAGIRAALDAAKDPCLNVTLVSDRAHFEYHAALYRVVAGQPPREVCVPLTEIFEGTKVEVVQDEIQAVDPAHRTARGVSRSYRYDHLILALGSETSYFDIPGLKELSFGFKSITEALRLRKHLSEIFTTCQVNAGSDEALCNAHIVVVGGGASGVELAGELAVRGRATMKQHGLDPGLLVVDLIEAAPRLLPALPEAMSERVMRHLRHIGVNVLLNRAVVKETIEGVYLKDMEMRTKTVIWAAGIAPNSFYKKVPGLEFGPRGRVVVDEYLEAKGAAGIFIAGDAAATPYAGMAQTALADGSYLAYLMGRRARGEKARAYTPKPVAYAVPVGPGWAAALWLGFRFYGRVGWFLRKAADLRFFLSILPFHKAIRVVSNTRLSRICAACLTP